MSNPLADLLALLSTPDHEAQIPGKMNWAHIKAMYPPPSPHEKPDRNGHVIRAHATQKNHRHVHNPVWLPGKPRISPAQYRHHHLGKHA